MVGFGKRFKEQQHEPWQRHYIRYTKLKRLLEQSDGGDWRSLVRHFSQNSASEDDPDSFGDPESARRFSGSFSGNGARSSPLDERARTPTPPPPPSSSSRLQQPLLAVGLLPASSSPTGQQFNAAFLSAFRDEIARVDAFFRQACDELAEDVALLEQQAQRFALSSPSPSPAAGGAEDPEARSGSAAKSSLRSLQRSYVEHYRTAAQLENFSILNGIACAKLLKRCRRAGKLEPDATAALEAEAEAAGFSSTHALRSLEEQLLDSFARYFCEGRRAEAKVLLLERQAEQVGDWTDFRHAWRFGAASLLIVWVVWDIAVDASLRADTVCASSPNATDPYTFWTDPVIKVYRFSGAMLLGCWVWGLLLFFWRRARVNVGFLLSLDESSGFVTSTEVFRIATILTIIFTTNFLLFDKIHRNDFFNAEELHGANRALPFALFVGTILCFLFPLRRSRRFWAVAGRVVTAPLRPVRFEDSYLADVFTSLVKPGTDLAYVLCYYASGDAFLPCPTAASTCESEPVLQDWVLPMLPFLALSFRFLQCVRGYHDTRLRMPHLANGFKYFFAQSVVIFGAFHKSLGSIDSGTVTAWQGIWISCYLLSTLYTYSWDVLMDCGFSMRWSKHRMLRERRMLSASRLPYYSAIVLDFFLRFLWTLSLSPGGQPFGGFVAYYVAPYLGFVEIIRRSGWSLFRLENEHLNNTSGYRRSKHVPLHFDAQGKTNNARPKTTSAWMVVLEISAALTVALALALIAGLTK